MYKSLFISSIFHTAIVVLSIFTLPFIAKQPLDIPPLVSVELIQISDKTNIPFAPKAKKIIDKIKKDKEKLVSEQAPPKKIKKDEKKEISPEKVEQQLPGIQVKKNSSTINNINANTTNNEKVEVKLMSTAGGSAVGSGARAVAQIKN